MKDWTSSREVYIVSHLLEAFMRNLSKISLLLVLVATFVAGCAADQNQQPAANPNAFAIENVTVIDLNTGEKLADQTVVVDGTQIAQAGPAAQVKAPAGARVVDGRNKFLIPGIWDMHIHAMRFPERALPLLVARGVSAARDMGADPSKIEPTRQAIANGTLISPRLYIAGEGLEGEAGKRPGHPPNTVLDTPDKARAQIQMLAGMKVDFLKAHNALQPPVYAAVMDEARKHNLPVDGHLHPGMDLIAASDAGQRTIEHMNGLQQSCAANPADLRAKPDAPPIQINRAKCEEVIKHLVGKGTWITPTLGGPGDGEPRTRAYDLALVKMAADGGLKLLAGTDYNGAGYPVHNYQGTNAYVMDEIEGMVEAGLTPLQALQTATVNPAMLTGIDNGSIAAGKLADMLLLDGDPLADITVTKRAAAVVVNGKLIDAVEMKRMIDNEMAMREKEKTEPLPPEIQQEVEAGQRGQRGQRGGQ
jgi:imidazolonepropionase-like amidohydrolase